MTASTYIQTYDGCVQVARTLARRVYEAVDQCMNGVEPAETVFPDLFNGVHGVDFLIGNDCNGIYYRGARIHVESGCYMACVDTRSQEVEVSSGLVTAVFPICEEDADFLTGFWDRYVRGQTVAVRD